MEILQNAPPLKTPAVTYALAAKFPCYAFNGARVKAQSLGNFCQRQDGIRGVHCLQTFRVWLTDARPPLEGVENLLRQTANALGRAFAAIMLNVRLIAAAEHAPDARYCLKRPRYPQSHGVV